MLQPVRIERDRVVVLDQRALPFKEIWVEVFDVQGVFNVIRDMVVRGAPAIGITAAGGIYLAALKWDKKKPLLEHLVNSGEFLKQARPTAVNLQWAVNRMIERAKRLIQDDADVVDGLFVEARAIHEEDIEMNKRMGMFGARLLPDKATVMTHCNAGALATGGYGTALGVLRAAKESGKDIRVVSCETRPYLQGARLTTWELLVDGFDVTLISDNMSGYMMSKGMIDAVIVGADRIAKNGDTANKIGTYTHAVLANRHGVPFYVAAPWSTVDLNTPEGSKIPIEERSEREVTHCGGNRIAPEGVKVFNPAFDVTPAGLITAIITDRGVFRPGKDGVDWDNPQK